MVVGECQWGFPLRIFNLCMSLSFPSQLRPIYKMFYKRLLFVVWPKHLIAYFPFFLVSRVPLVPWELSGLCHPSCCLTLSASLSYIPLLSNYGPILSVCLSLLLCYSIEFSLLSILLSNLCSSRISLHQNSPKSLSLHYQVIELSSLLWQASWCLLPAQGKILLLCFNYPYFFSSFFSWFGASCSEMTCFSTIVTSPYLSASVHIHCIGVLPRNIQNRFLPHIPWVI